MRVACLGAALLLAGAAGLGQSFTNVGAMSVARNDAAAVRLSDGTVLVAGGWNQTGAQSTDVIPLASAEIYDPSSASFHLTGSMSQGRVYALAEPLPGGKAIIIGGETPAIGRGGLASTTEIYDSASGQFSPGPKLPQPLQAPLAAVLPDGRIWISGAPADCTGYGCPSPAYLYDPSSNGFTADGGLVYERVQATVVVLSNGKILAVSGWGDNPGTSPLASYEIYDPASGVSTLGTAVGLGTSAASGVLLGNGQVLLCGGDGHFGAAQACDVYDPAKDAWSATGNMQQGRLAPVGFVLPDGSVLEASSEANPNAEIYGAPAGSFSNAGNFNTARSRFSAVQLQDGSVLFAGGGTASAEVFMPASVPPDFTLTTPHGEVVTAVSSATIPIAASASAGFSDAIRLSCTGNSNVTCAFAPASIHPGQTSTLSVTGLSATAPDQVFQVVGVSGMLTNTLPLEVVVEPPAAAVAPLTLDFGSTAVGSTSAAQTFTINNRGEAALRISGVSVAGDFSQTNDCAAAINPGAAGCTVTVTFTPTAAGQRSGSVSVNDNSLLPASPQMVTLQGTATAPPAPLAQLAPGSLSFGATTVGQTSPAQTVTLSNSGNAVLANVAVSVSGPFQQSNTCGSSVAAAGKCTMAITFAPTASGSQSGTLEVNDNDAHSPQTVTLSGTGDPAAPATPQASLAPTELSFGSESVGSTSDAQDVTLTNSGSAALTLASVAASGDFAESHHCGTSVAAGKSCSIAVTFTPTAAGARSGTLTVTPGSGGALTAMLTGTGTAPASGGGSVNFQLPAGASTTQTVSPGQTATYALQVVASGGLSGPVTLACSGAPSGATCTPTPASVMVGAGPSTAVAVTVAVTTTEAGSVGWLAGWEWLGLAGLLLSALAPGPRSRKRVWVAAAAMMLAGCGSSSPASQGGQTSGSATPSGSYTLTLTASAGGAAVGSEALTLVVQ